MDGILGLVFGGGREGVAPTSVVAADDTIRSVMPEVIGTCALSAGGMAGGPCTDAATLDVLGKAMGIAGGPADILEESKKRLGCPDERCVLNRASTYIGEEVAQRELIRAFKIPGPLDNSLLSNVNIDGIMMQWTVAFPYFFGYNFNMRNYAEYSFDNGRIVATPDTLATLAFADIVRKGRECAGCVINTDVYQGRGKHWMALFADVRDGRRTVEYFNSSGNNPAPEWVNWMERTRDGLLALGERPPVEVIKVNRIRQQDSKTECGLYALFYIWARINKVPPEYFNTTRVYDQYMFEFRAHLYEDREAPRKFDWAEYQTRVKVSWEK